MANSWSRENVGIVSQRVCIDAWISGETNLNQISTPHSGRIRTRKVKTQVQYMI